MAKAIPITEHFQHFLAEMQAQLLGDLYAREGICVDLRATKPRMHPTQGNSAAECIEIQDRIHELRSMRRCANTCSTEPKRERELPAKL
jgi:hypothetical protein